MIVKFKTTGGEAQGKVLSRGWHNVDKPESYLVDLGHAVKWVPVTECEAA